MNLCPELRRLVAEHDRWLAELAMQRDRGDEERATWLLALWDHEILLHCRREEDVLVPELARRVPEADAVILFTLADHVVLRRLARELRAAEGAERGKVADRLALKLAEHVAFEERTLFPAVQERIGCDRMAALRDELVGVEKPRARDGPRRVAIQRDRGKT